MRRGLTLRYATSMRRVLVIVGGLGLALLITCGGLAVVVWRDPILIARWTMRPSGPFDPATAPPAPDYDEPSSWAARPDRRDAADVRPAGDPPAPDPSTLAVDAFFVHPTTYWSGGAGWNAPIDEPESRELTESGVMRHQASAFNECCRVYAPFYRQATLYAYLDTEGDGQRALELAYDDVRRAFICFIAQTGDRPFVLAGHSQGTTHLIRLVQEEVIGTPRAARLVAAYMIGQSVPPSLDGLEVCAGPSDTGCYVGWNSMTTESDGEGWRTMSEVWLDGGWRTFPGPHPVCVNPLSWIPDGGHVAASANLGGMAFAEPDGPMLALVPGLTDARCDDGRLFITRPDRSAGDFSVFTNRGDFHLYDYNLFYANIRANAAERVRAYLSERPEGAP